MNQGRKTCWGMEVQQMGSGRFQDMLVLWEWPVQGASTVRLILHLASRCLQSNAGILAEGYQSSSKVLPKR